MERLGKEGGNVRQLGDSKHVVQSNFSNNTAIKRANEARNGQQLFRNKAPTDLKSIMPKKNAKILDGLFKLCR